MWCQNPRFEKFGGSSSSGRGDSTPSEQGLVSADPARFADPSFAVRGRVQLGSRGSQAVARRGGVLAAKIHQMDISRLKVPDQVRCQMAVGVATSAVSVQN